MVEYVQCIRHGLRQGEIWKRTQHRLRARKHDGDLKLKVQEETAAAAGDRVRGDHPDRLYRCLTLQSSRMQGKVDDGAVEQHGKVKVNWELEMGHRSNKARIEGTVLVLFGKGG
jgi:hypothetical protein